jgi:hypothetical protein
MVQTFVTLHNSPKAQALAGTCTMITCARLIIRKNYRRFSGTYLANNPGNSHFTRHQNIALSELTLRKISAHALIRDPTTERNKQTHTRAEPASHSPNSQAPGSERIST